MDTLPRPAVEAALERAIAAVSALQRAYGDDLDAYKIWIMAEALRKRRTPEAVARLEAERARTRWR